MIFSGDESRAFWGAASQIVPIIALALVIETRALAQRWRSKKFKKQRALRWTLGITYLIVIVPLPTVLLLSLFNTAKERTSEVEMIFVAVWIGVGIYLVAYMPAATLIGAALTDFIQLVGDKLPWSRVKRGRRNLREFDQLLAARVRSERGRRIENLMMLVDVYVPLVPLEIAADKIKPNRALHHQFESIHARLRSISETDAVIKEVILGWETVRREQISRFNAALELRNNDVLKQMTRMTKDQLAGITR